jgi:hypothetical protein
LSYALQVRFLRLAPCEDLIARAAAHYKQMRRVLAGPGECTVSLERDAQLPARTHAVVRIRHLGQAWAEASATHPESEVALELALREVHAQLGAPHVPPGEARYESAPLA